MPISLQDETARLIAQEAAAFAAQVRQPAAREAFERLAAAASERSIPDELLPVLGQLLHLTLTSGRIAARYGPREEQVLSEVFRRTPAGRQLEEQVAQANAALATLQGLAIERLHLAAAGPGRYRLAVEAGGRRLVLDLGPAGAGARSLELAL
ncbi:hypothetical protein Tmar_1632 [Thermaerobacter marianensis DSM 12885]|uniref:Uncharacterized protein n=1 Tax=Thermaerobacter marianensis (strain ATCC 700841 / DSM 12885 / JCM 10246 / 7p75a) TaxID=644966 RepID=E6SH77_THEM7|nr:hypothetical protein [Thermaerobacter marianensis]ADU51741.1 hypothetical protein Tmar_1632 [Thermaerobacter marianensis DSM 12885]